MTAPVSRTSLAVNSILQTYRIQKSGQNTVHGDIPSALRHCPVDGNPLQRILISDTIIDICPVCHGIWFDAGELRTLLGLNKSAERNDLQTLLEKKGHPNPPIDKLEKWCPACREPMFHRVNRKADVLLDVCSKCAGVWTDGGEFALLFFQAREKGQPEPEAVRQAAGKLLDLRI